MHPFLEKIESYRSGPAILRQAISGMSNTELDVRPIPGKWSTRFVVCHVSDFELVYADRMKRILAQTEPLLLDGDPDSFAAHLSYGKRAVDTELFLVEQVRRQMTTILLNLDAEDFDRKGIHSVNGAVTLEALLDGINHHLMHHVSFIKEKRLAIQSNRNDSKWLEN